MDMLKKMQSEESYFAYNSEMPIEIQRKARDLCYEFNHASPKEGDKKKQILKSLFGTCSDLTFIEPTFQCDYGINIHTHGLTVINFNVTILDTSPVNIGKNCFIAPNVVISCAGHSIDAKEREEGVLVSKPITIGDNVWIGANATLIGGIKIGSNVVIGAGSVVTKNIPSNVVAVGNPCKILRKINENDKLMLKNNLANHN